jgi:formylglycine-generating enzyme required for sulfatase activity
MVPVPTGPITLSDRRTERSWTVETGPFEIGRTSVTRLEYADCMGRHPPSSSEELLPVADVSWWDAVLFCNALSARAGLSAAYRVCGEDVAWDRSADGFRMPSEAEWERACRAGSAGPRYGALDEIAGFRGNSGGTAHGVGGKEPNAWGLHDTLGNVWEWCWDLADPVVYGSYRVLRGGGWFDEHWSCRASVRRRSHPTFQIDDVGFRVARGASRPERSGEREDVAGAAENRCSLRIERGRAD